MGRDGISRHWEKNMAGRIIFFVAVGLLLMCMSPASPAYAEGHAGGSAGKASDPDAPHPDFEYLELDPLNLPVITTKGLTQQVSLLVSLEVDFGTKDGIGLYKPRLTDAYIQDLYGALGAGFALIHGNIVDVRQIKQRLTSVTARVLGPEHKVNSVLLQVVRQRPM